MVLVYICFIQLICYKNVMLEVAVTVWKVIGEAG